MIQARSQISEALSLLRDLVREYPGRLTAILIAAATFGFGIASASVLSAKYLQSDFHYSPLDVNLLFISGGLIGLSLAIRTGRLSDHIGRKRTTIGIVALAGIGFACFYSGLGGWWLPPLWIISFFGFFSGEALIAGFALEIVPTRYRATVSGLRYLDGDRSGGDRIAVGRTSV